MRTISGHQLRWWDINPATHPFDEARVRALVEDAFACCGPMPSPQQIPEILERRKKQSEHIERYIEAIEERLLLNVGDVDMGGVCLFGWLWDVNDGGPVRTTVTYGGDETNADTLIAAIVEWRRFLESLAETFDALKGDLERQSSEEPRNPRQRFASIAESVSAAAVRIVPIVVGVTGASDAWYGTCEVVLGWYLESAGYEVKPDVIEQALSGRFESWIAPTPTAIREASDALGSAIARVETERAEPIDALSMWLACRVVSMDERPESRLEGRRREPLREDGHRRFIQCHDRPRDADRADRMEVALDLARAWAATDNPLSFDELAMWQGVVLGIASGEKAAFRTRDAYAKNGLEYYPVERARETLDKLLAEALNESVALPVRAANVYLDICFVHPFEDGAARSARLALDALLTRAGYGLHTAAPIFMLSRWAGDWNGGRVFAKLVDTLMAPISSVR